MADVATPALIAASGVPVVIFAGAVGFDHLSMAGGLAGVVIAQTLLPATVNGLKAVIALGLGSTLLATILAPFVAPAAASLFPNSGWLSQVAPEQVKVASAAFVGAFAQPLLLWIRDLLPKKKETTITGKVE